MLLLNSIIQDPEIAEGPKRLSLGPLVAGDDVDEITMHKIASLMKDQSSAIDALVRDCSFIPKAKQEWWTNAIIHWNNPDAAIALLITVFPNLENLDALDWSYYDGSRASHDMISDIIEANLRREPPLHNRAMTRLKEFRMCCSDEYGESLGDYAPFAMLPSMRVLSGSHITDTAFIWAPSWVGESSNITEINFTYSAIEYDSFESLLSRISGLKRFAYSYGDHNVGYTAYRPWNLVEALREHAFSTLELLDITVAGPRDLLSYEDIERLDVESLQEFDRLTSVRLEDNAFQRIEEMGDDDEPLPDDEFCREDSAGFVFKVETRRLLDVLPPSVKSVTIINTMEVRELWRMFRGLVDGKQVDLPRLHSIRFEGADPLDVEMREALEGAGITLKISDDTL